MANIELVLLKDIDGLGLAGAIVKVAPGYARNYLEPKGFAAKASKGAIRQFEARKDEIVANRKAALEGAQAIAAKITDIEVLFTMEASDDNVLFGSITERNIAESLAEKDIKVSRNDIKLTEHIKMLGKYDVDIDLHNSVTATVKVVVERA